MDKVKSKEISYFFENFHFEDKQTKELASTHANFTIFLKKFFHIPNKDLKTIMFSLFEDHPYFEVRDILIDKDKKDKQIYLQLESIKTKEEYLYLLYNDKIHSLFYHINETSLSDNINTMENKSINYLKKDLNQMLNRYGQEYYNYHFLLEEKF